jgi:2-dehydropantoate 2-reductase
MGERVAVVGAGAIGMLFAAALGKAGRDVLLCSRRPASYSDIRVDLGDQSWQVPIPVFNEPEKVTPVDWILLATKSYDVPAAARWLDALAAPGANLVVLQNGIDHAERLSPWLPQRARVMPSVLYIGSEVVGSGHVRWTFGDSVAVPAGQHGERFAALMSDSPIGVDRVVDFDQLAWRKLLVNLTVSPVTALTGRRVEVFTDTGVRELGRELIAEASATARAAGVDLPAAAAIDATLGFIDTLAPDVSSSMLMDREAHRPTEHELIIGSVVRLAMRHGVSVPATRTLLTLLRNSR